MKIECTYIVVVAYWIASAIKLYPEEVSLEKQLRYYTKNHDYVKVHATSTGGGSSNYFIELGNGTIIPVVGKLRAALINIL